MGIMNMTSDSFYAGSRVQTAYEIAERAEQMLSEGASIIDVGACSTRPGAPLSDPIDERKRLSLALSTIRRHAPQAILSVDTYHADVAAMAVEEYGVGIINDISAGEMDKQMFHTVARLNVPYVLTHMQGTPADMQQSPHYNHLLQELLTFLTRKSEQLHSMGVKDIIIDPGFGFGKTIQHNYQLMSHLSELHLLNHPLMVGISRKSMIHKLLDIPPEDSLNGTTALHLIALMQGAHLLRVHDVKACHECIRIWKELQSATLQETTANLLTQITNNH